MSSSVRPELLTCVGSSASLQTRPSPLIYRGLTVQTNRATSVRERAVRMVQEHRGEYPSLWACIESIAPKIGCVPQTLNDWVKQQEIDTGTRDGLSTDERERIKSLEREVKELRRANDILKTASAFFAQAELDRRLKS